MSEMIYLAYLVLDLKHAQCNYFELRTLLRVKDKPDNPVLEASKCLECTINQDIRLSRH